MAGVRPAPRPAQGRPRHPLTPRRATPHALRFAGSQCLPAPVTGCLSMFIQGWVLMQQREKR